MSSHVGGELRNVAGRAGLYSIMLNPEPILEGRKVVIYLIGELGCLSKVGSW